LALPSEVRTSDGIDSVGFDAFALGPEVDGFELHPSGSTRPQDAPL
jgi:hypothetical protein